MTDQMPDGRHPIDALVALEMRVLALETRLHAWEARNDIGAVGKAVAEVAPPSPAPVSPPPPAPAAAPSSPPPPEPEAPAGV